MKRDSNGRFMSHKQDYVWVMKSVNKNMSSTWDSKFIYPESGIVEAPDWNDIPEYRKGLHGFLWGEGQTNERNDFSSNSNWLLIRVNPEDGLVQTKSNYMFKRGEVMMVGDCHEIANEMLKHLPNDRPYRVIGSVITGGDKSVIVGGDRSILEGGDDSTVTGGVYSKIIGGYDSILIGGRYSRVMGKDNSIIILEYWAGNGYTRKMVKIGENGILPNIEYQLNINHKLMKA